MSEQPLLEVSDKVETSYGQSRVLFGMSFAIAPGEMVTLMGRNGMGKTTTVRSIMGLTRGDRGLDPLCRRGDPRSAVLKAAQNSASAWCRKAAQVFPNLTTRENLVATAANRSRRRSMDARKGAGAVSAARQPRRPPWRTCCRAASSRCWRSGAR